MYLLAMVMATVTAPFPPLPPEVSQAAPPLSETEVRARLANGEADLRRRGGARQELPAAVLARLLERPPVVSGRSRGVWLRGAKVTGDLDLRNAIVGVDVRLVDCEFTEAVMLTGAKFQKGLAVDGSVFAGPVDAVGAEVLGAVSGAQARFEWPGGPANFTGLVARGVDLDRAVFRGGVRFGAAQVDGTLYLAGAVIEPVDPWRDRLAVQLGWALGPAQGGPLHALPMALLVGPHAWFSEITVSRDLVVSEATFAGPVDFSFARIGRDLIAGRARFDDPTWGVWFESVKVAGHLSLNGSTFAGAVNGSRADVGADLDAGGARFAHPSADLELMSAKVGGSVGLGGAEFAAGATLIQSDIKLNIIITKSQFRNSHCCFDLSGTKVGGAVLMAAAEFDSWVNLNYVSVGRVLDANGVRFRNPGALGVSFNSAHVGVDLFLNGAEFDTPADFSHVSVGENLEARNVKFRAARVWPSETEPSWTVSFNTATVGRYAVFDGAEFGGGRDAGGADFRSCTVGFNFDVSAAVFRGYASFASARVRGATVMKGATFQAGATFSQSEINGLFDVSDAQFTDPDMVTDFFSLKADRVRVQGARFAGPAAFSRLFTNGFNGVGARFEALGVSADFSTARVKGYFSLDNARFAGGVLAGQCDLQWIHLDDVSIPARQGSAGTVDRKSVV